MNLYGTMFDGVSLRTRIGIEMEFMEMLEMVQRAEKVPAAEIQRVVAHVKRDWTFVKPADPATLEKGAAWYLAIRDKARERGWQAVSLIDVDGFKKLLGLPAVHDLHAPVRGSRAVHGARRTTASAR